MTIIAHLTCDDVLDRAFFLNTLDAAMEKLGLFYVRFMDDILVLAPTRWKLRSAVKAINQVLGGLGLEKHPDKTFIGRIERGFDFLGYHFSPAGLSVAKQTVANFIEKASRLYEQERSRPSGASPLEMYARRWLRWCKGGMQAKTTRAVDNGFNVHEAVRQSWSQRNGPAPPGGVRLPPGP